MELDARKTVLLADAISLAILAMERLPEAERPENDILELRILRSCLPGVVSGESQITAERRLEILMARPTADVLPFPKR